MIVVYKKITQKYLDLFFIFIKFNFECAIYLTQY